MLKLSDLTLLTFLNDMVKYTTILARLKTLCKSLSFLILIFSHYRTQTNNSRYQIVTAFRVSEFDSKCKFKSTDDDAETFLHIIFKIFGIFLGEILWKKWMVSSFAKTFWFISPTSHKVHTAKANLPQKSNTKVEGSLKTLILSGHLEQRGSDEMLRKTYVVQPIVSLTQHYDEF